MIIVKEILFCFCTYSLPCGFIHVAMVIQVCSLFISVTSFSIYTDLIIHKQQRRTVNFQNVGTI